jgi:hypothetical protein
VGAEEGKRRRGSLFFPLLLPNLDSYPLPVCVKLLRQAKKICIIFFSQARMFWPQNKAATNIEFLFFWKVEKFFEIFPDDWFLKTSLVKLSLFM